MQRADVGIITFHCSDNYGAMLQAYGLKNYLRIRGIKAEIIRYEPFFMVGRNWLIPYAPVGSIAGVLRYACWGMKSHMKMSKDLLRLRRNMQSFRETYLIDKRSKRLRFAPQMKTLSYKYYIIGSDQIWNPDITFGLRRVYFGDFRNKRKEKVIAYAASLGGRSLSVEYDEKFTELLNHVDAISVREKEALSYVERHCIGKASAVLDPVFLLTKEDWKKLEISPDLPHYIVVYRAEENPEMSAYLKTFSREKNLPVIELKVTCEKKESDFIVDAVAGPAQFLGYLHKADYVITNSFHAVAFSIIFEKRFMAFSHTSRNERLNNILKICGLTERIYHRENPPKMDEDIAWEKVKNNLKEEIRHAEDFLTESLLSKEE